MARVKESTPYSYPLRKYYVGMGYFGMASWVFSMIFHARDFLWTERFDYFAAGASVLYGLYYTPVRIFRLYQKTPFKQSALRLWTLCCVCLYAAHVTYLLAWKWDYTYNMAANIAVGMVYNIFWISWSISRYRRTGESWTLWPALIIGWIMMVMGLELFDFPPWGRMLDAHSLWHLGTVLPTIWWYR